MQLTLKARFGISPRMPHLLRKLAVCIGIWGVVPAAALACSGPEATKVMAVSELIALLSFGASASLVFVFRR